MKNIKSFIKLTINVLFFISIFNSINAKSFDTSDKIGSYLSGIISFENNEYANSFKYLNGLKDLEEHHLSYARLYQHSLVNLERIEDAFKYGKKLERQKIYNFENNIIMGVYYLKNNQFDEAKKFFKRLDEMKNHSNLTGILSKSLNNWVAFNDLNEKEALKLIDKIPSKFENIKKIQSAFTGCFYDSDKTDMFFQNLITDQTVDFSRYNYFYANYYLKKENREKANQIINQALKLYPNNLILNQFKHDFKKEKIEANKFDCKNASHIIAEIFYITSNALSQNSLYSISNFYLNLAKYLNSEFISFDTLYAENYYMIDSYDQSKKIYNKIKRKGNFYNWYASKQIARILIKQKKNEEAYNFLSKNFKMIKKPNVSQLYDYGDFLKNNKKYDDAVFYLTKVLNQIDKNHFLYAKTSDSRGVAYERLSKWEKAETDLLNSLSVEPNEAYVINYLAYTWIEKGINIENSLKMLRKANELKKNDGYIIDSLGWALFKLKRYNEAKDQLRLAVAIMPSDPVVNDHYADSLWMSKNFLQAKYFWNNVLNLEDAEEDLKKEVKRKLIFGLSEELN